jgi:hypothetical protein
LKYKSLAVSLLCGNGSTLKRQLLQTCSAVGSGGSGERASRQPPLPPSATSLSARPGRAATLFAAFGRRTWKAAALEAALTGSVALMSTPTVAKSHAPGTRGSSLQRL